MELLLCESDISHSIAIAVSLRGCVYDFFNGDFFVDHFIGLVGETAAVNFSMLVCHDVAFNSSNDNQAYPDLFSLHHVNVLVIFPDLFSLTYS